jgi:integrase/recombinase XerD
VYCFFVNKDFPDAPIVLSLMSARSRAPNDRRIIGEDIKDVEFSWPIGMPLVRSLGRELWKCGAAYRGRIARVPLASGLRLQQPRRVIVPLSSDQVATFWSGFHTFRDLALVGLMLLDGLRSCEVLALQLEDLQLADAQMRVLGKGNKQRLLPLPQEIIEALQNYLCMERPITHSRSVFVCLKGPHRGQPMTSAGLRSLFRHHRAGSQVPAANPHRFRHTFGADMVRAGISLPALQQLMGHSQICTTMLYVQLAPKDVWSEYTRAIEKRTHPHPSPIV